jgi:hypothetical protein
MEIKWYCEPFFLWKKPDLKQKKPAGTWQTLIMKTRRKSNKQSKKKRVLKSRVLLPWKVGSLDIGQIYYI